MKPSLTADGVRVFQRPTFSQGPNVQKDRWGPAVDVARFLWGAGVPSVVDSDGSFSQDVPTVYCVYLERLERVLEPLWRDSGGLLGHLSDVCTVRSRPALLLGVMLNQASRFLPKKRY